jgi:hypothetical protein
MDRLSQLHHAALESLLEQVFSELSPPGHWDRLESLELDLGTLQASDLEQQLPQRLEVALRRALAARLPPPLPQPLQLSITPLNQPPLIQSPAAPNRPLPPASDPPETSTATASPAADADELQRQLELLALFTATGSLPWWAPRHDRHLIAAALDTALALPPPELRALLHQLAGAPGEPSAALQRLLAAASPEQRPRIEQALQEAALEGEAAMKAAQVEALDAALQKALKPTEPAASDPTATARPTASAAPPPPLALQLPKATPLSAQQPSRQVPLTAAAEPAAANAPDLKLQPADDDLVIDGAGMVLLWPFLETLFCRLELLTQERLFGDEAQRQRAMALLGFLVDGDGDPPEWRLTLAKLLCGALPQAPYGLDAPLSDAEQAEAEALLQALLGHAAGQLGDDGAALRQDFLQRPGLLSARPGAWVLQVERRPGDEVLDGLPWSWSWIRLPWMDDLLQVVW